MALYVLTASCSLVLLAVIYLASMGYIIEAARLLVFSVLGGLASVAASWLVAVVCCPRRKRPCAVRVAAIARGTTQVGDGGAGLMVWLGR